MITFAHISKMCAIRASVFGSRRYGVWKEACAYAFNQTINPVMQNIRHIVLFDTETSHGNLLPLSFTRPVAEFRVGITTVREKWEALFPGEYCFLPVDYLREKFSYCARREEDFYFVAGCWIPDARAVGLLEGLSSGEAIVDKDGALLAFKGGMEAFEKEEFAKVTEVGEDLPVIRYVFDVFRLNKDAIAADYARLTRGRSSRPVPACVRVSGDLLDADGNPRLFIEEGAVLENCVINLVDGPVYVGRNVQVMDGACVRGPLALCDNVKIRIGAKVYGGTTFGPYCKIGGEVDNTVVFGFSNKAHDGYLGNAVIGEWCNIGAGVNASNLKNDYSKVRIWNYPSHSFMRTDLQFCGLVMGDHSKIGVNCMLNTATVLGVGVNIHGAGFPRVFVPSFSEGSATGGFSDVRLTKFYDIAARAMSRRGIDMTPVDHRIYERVYEVASRYKNPGKKG